MKKFLMTAACGLLAFSLSVFAACGDDTPKKGTVEGDFSQEATETEVTDAADALDSAFESGTLIGDVESEDWSFGAALSAEAEIKFTVDGESSTTSFSLDYKLTGAPGETDSLALAGAGSFSLKGEESADMSVYNDADNVYIDMSSAEGGAKIRMSWSALFETIGSLGGSMLPAAMAADTQLPAESQPGGSEPGASDTATEEENWFADLFLSLTEAGFKIYVDDSDGVKVKISATDSVMAALAADLGSDTGAAGLAFEEGAVLDAYIAMDKDGALSQVSAVVDISATMTMEGAAVGFALSGNISVSSFDGKVELPSDLSSYMDMSGAAMTA